MAKRSKKKHKRNLVKFYILAFLLFVTLLIALPIVQTRIATHAQGTTGILYSPQSAKNSLQLYWFLIPTTDLSPNNYPSGQIVSPSKAEPQISQPQTEIPIAKIVQLQPGTGITPPASGTGVSAPAPVESCGVAKGSKTKTCCVADGYTTSASNCCPNLAYSTTCAEFPISPQCKSGKDPIWCDDKPVIYLYPKVKTSVSVTVSVPGSITTSIPRYPKSGWNNITAYPDGHFEYNGKSFTELFYESSIKPSANPTAGIVVPISLVKGTLGTIATRLGLSVSERAELLSYWIPKLQNLGEPYILLSVFPQQEKDTIDHVEINPKPDTFIQMIFYFKGLSSPITVSPLVLPVSIPQRIGFTAVEWGGIIGN